MWMYGDLVTQFGARVKSVQSRSAGSGPVLAEQDLMQPDVLITHGTAFV